MGAARHLAPLAPVVQLLLTYLEDADQDACLHTRPPTVSLAAGRAEPTKPPHAPKRLQQLYGVLQPAGVSSSQMLAGMALETHPAALTRCQSSTPLHLARAVGRGHQVEALRRGVELRGPGHWRQPMRALQALRNSRVAAAPTAPRAHTTSQHVARWLPPWWAAGAAHPAESMNATPSGDPHAS